MKFQQYHIIFELVSLGSKTIEKSVRQHKKSKKSRNISNNNRNAQKYCETIIERFVIYTSISRTNARCIIPRVISELKTKADD